MKKIFFYYIYYVIFLDFFFFFYKSVVLFSGPIYFNFHGWAYWTSSHRMHPRQLSSTMEDIPEEEQTAPRMLFTSIWVNLQNGLTPDVGHPRGKPKPRPTWRPNIYIDEPTF